MGLAEVLLEEAREEIVRATNQVAAARFARDVAADVRECRGLKRRTVIPVSYTHLTLPTKA